MEDKKQIKIGLTALCIIIIIFILSAIIIYTVVASSKEKESENRYINTVDINETNTYN